MKRQPSPKAIVTVAATALLMLCLIILLPPDTVMAEQYAGHGLGSTGGVSGLGELSTDLPTMIGRIINALLGLVGVVFLLLIIYAGFLWMTAGGNEEQVKKSRSLIINSVAGLAIVFAAYAITVFVINAVAPPTGVTTEGETVTGEDPLEQLINESVEGECVGEWCDEIEGL